MDAPKVTAGNYVRAESDIQMIGYIDSFEILGKFHHSRQAYDVDNQITIRGNRDTLYSFGVFDLRSPGARSAEGEILPPNGLCDFPYRLLDTTSLKSDTMSEKKRSSCQLRAVPQPTSKITKSDRTRAAILNAALEFIWSRPFRDMTVNSLMASTDLSRSAFYQYFEDIHKMMETLLQMLAEEIFTSSNVWLEGVGDPVALMNETFEGLNRTCYRHGPFLRAVSDAAVADERFEKNWVQFLGAFDDAGIARIEADQAQGLIAVFDARPVAFALNRLNAYTFIDAFGQRPRSKPKPIQEALARVWISTLYGAEWAGSGSSTLVRT